MTADLFDNLTPEIPRDRWKRPLIVPPDGGAPIAYVRASSFATALDDPGGLPKWKARMVALGIGRHEDLAAMVAGLEYGDPKLDEIIETAHDRAGGNAKANYGTAVHTFTDPGAPSAPARMTADVDAYHAELARHGGTVIAHDRFIVNDALGVAGTFDAIIGFPKVGNRVEDRKTGTLHPLAVAIQLAIYAGGVYYTIGPDGQPVREALPDVDQDTGIVAHVPAGKGTCTFHAVDLNLGRAAVELALDVRAWRARKDLCSPLAVGFPEPPAVVEPAKVSDPAAGDRLGDLIAAAPTLDALRDLWAANQTGWDDSHSELARARKVFIQAAG